MAKRPELYLIFCASLRKAPSLYPLIDLTEFVDLSQTTTALEAVINSS